MARANKAALVMGQSILPRRLKLVASDPVEIVDTMIERMPDLVGKQAFIVKIVGHGSIPFIFSAAASVWVAREQCVLTLPSEQPIAAAVSAISMSSQ